MTISDGDRTVTHMKRRWPRYGDEDGSSDGGSDAGSEQFFEADPREGEGEGGGGGKAVVVVVDQDQDHGGGGEVDDGDEDAPQEGSTVYGSMGLTSGRSMWRIRLSGVGLRQHVGVGVSTASLINQAGYLQDSAVFFCDYPPDKDGEDGGRSRAGSGGARDGGMGNRGQPGMAWGGGGGGGGGGEQQSRGSSRESARPAGGGVAEVPAAVPTASTKDAGFMISVAEDAVVSVVVDFRREGGVDAVFVDYYNGKSLIKSSRLTAAAVGDPLVDLYPFVTLFSPGCSATFMSD